MKSTTISKATQKNQFYRCTATNKVGDDVSNFKVIRTRMFSLNLYISLTLSEVCVRVHVRACVCDTKMTCLVDDLSYEECCIASQN